MPLRPPSPDSYTLVPALSQGNAGGKKGVGKKSVTFNHDVAVVEYNTNKTGVDLKALNIAQAVFGKKGKPKHIATNYREKSIPTEKLPAEFNKLNAFFKEKIVTGLADTSTYRTKNFYKHEELINQTTELTEFKKENTNYKPVFGYDKDTNSHVLILTCSLKCAVVLSHDLKTKISTLKELDYEKLQLYVERDPDSEGGAKVLTPPGSPVSMQLVSDVLSEYTLNPVKARRSPSFEYRKEHCDLNKADLERQEGLSGKRERVYTYRNAQIEKANKAFRSVHPLLTP